MAAQANDDHLIRLPREHSKHNYLAGFWRWVSILAEGDYRRALEALHWPTGTTWTPDTFRKFITTFFGGNEPWSVVIPNNRLVDVINDAAEFDLDRPDGGGWFRAQIPLTTDPTDPKNDGILLMGLAVSFFVREHDGSFVLEFEIFHL